MADAAEEAAATGLRIAAATAACLMLSVWLQLEQAALSVITVFIVLVQHPFSALQKGIERLVGRTTGLAFGLVPVLLFRDAPLLYFLTLEVGLLGFGYLFAAGRLSYTAVNGLMFLGVMGAMGAAAPAGAPAFAAAAVAQLALGLGAVVIVNNLTGVAEPLAIDTGEGALWPLRGAWVSQAAMLASVISAALALTLWLELPATATLISATLIASAPGGRRGAAVKAWQRALGALAGGAAALLAMGLLALMPYFLLLVALLIVGLFAFALQTKLRGEQSYVFLQGGATFILVLIAPEADLGTMQTAVGRLVGVAAGLLIAEALLFVWPEAAPTS